MIGSGSSQIKKGQGGLVNAGMYITDSSMSSMWNLM